MTAWCHLPTILNRRTVLRIIGLLALCAAFITTLFFANVSLASPNTTKVITFQGRLLTPGGSVVPDGNYNIQFKIYEDGNGTTAGNPGGSLKWTESYVNDGGDSGVEVRSGFFSVSLGSQTPFGTSVDWNADTIWLSMNVAGADEDCTTFGTSPCTADGEMLPMRRITATPFAINSSQLGGKTADNFIQLAQGVQTDASSNTSSIFINKTSTGNLVQLQNSAVDIFTIENDGDLTLGSNADKTISVAVSGADTEGKDLTVVAGDGGSGNGSTGGDLVLQGGAAGGTNGNGGNIEIDAGAGTGTGIDGQIAIGSTNASSIIIGSTDQAVDQDIAIGANNNGGTSNVTIGSGGSAAGGDTTIQAKNSVEIATNGQTRATFSGDSNTVYFGNGVSSATPSDATIQGTDSSATAVAGGSLTIQGGNATTGDANGGNVVLTGGNGSGNGAKGLVVMTTPTFSTVTNDANCYTGGALVASSCTITNNTVNGSSAVLVGFSTSGRTATLPDPAQTTAGRIIYVMAAGGSQDFTLRANVGDDGEQSLSMRKNTTATLIWNGSDWTSAGTGAASLQNAYDNTPQSAGGDELVVNNTTGNLTIRDSSTNPVNDSLIEVKNSSNDSIFSVNKKVPNGTEHASDGTVNDAGNFATNWTAAGGASVSRNTTDGQQGSDSAEVAAGTSEGAGVRNKLAINPALNSTYRASVYAKLASGEAFTDFTVRYSPDGGSTFIDCTNYSTQTITTSGWTQITCDIATGATAVTDPYLYLVQPSSPSSARTFLVDTLSFTLASNSTQNVKVGSDNTNDPTLFTLDKSASAPTADNNEALLGSMYYDTSLGKVQCYESEGWGNCGASPDTFITISPEYTNAVMNGADAGTISSDLCSDSLNINDGSGGQPEICGENETYNFYRWATEEDTDQTRSIFVTYQLPTNFKEFVAGSTSLAGRTDSADASINYEIYRDNGSGLTSCGTVSVSSGTQTSWQTAAAVGGSDPSTCGFSAGDSVFFRINLTTKGDASAYVSNLNFTFSNN